MPELSSPLAALGLEPCPDPDPATLHTLLPEALVEQLYRAFRSGDDGLQGEVMLRLADCQLRSYRYDAALLWLVRARSYVAGNVPTYNFERTLANLARRLGHADAAAAAAGAALSVAQDAGLPQFTAESLSLRGAVLAVAGRFEESAADLRDAIKLFRRQKNRFGEAEASFREADRLLRMEDRYRALELADGAVEKVGDGGTPSLVAKGVYLRGKCRLALADARKSLSDLDFARDLARAQESRELHWHIEAARAEALALTRLQREAAEAIDDAKRRLEDLALGLAHVPVRERFLGRPDVQAFLKSLKKR